MKAELVDFMGDDIRVVNAARVSFAKESEWEIDYENSYKESGVIVDPEIKISEGDQKLIKYLASHNHWTPFSHVQITLREKVPIFVARQRFKHMVGFTYNEVSRRYVDDEPTFFAPTAWRKRAENKKQGSTDEEVERIMFYGDVECWEENTDSLYWSAIRSCELLYLSMIRGGVAPEQARMVLPQSMYTEYYVTGSLAAWARAYKLRIDPHAQKEIQDLAILWQEAIGSIKELEHSWKALTI